VETPAEVKEWAQNTVMGVLFGLILGGGRQWLEDRKYGKTSGLNDGPPHAVKLLPRSRLRGTAQQSVV